MNKHGLLEIIMRRWGNKLKSRLSFEKFLSADEFQLFLEVATNEKVAVMNYGSVFTAKEVRQIYEGILKINMLHESFGYFKVFLKETGTYIGLGALVVDEDFLEGEVEYMLLPEYWGQGYGNEIVEELVKRAESTKSIVRIMAITDPNNISSKKILKNNSFVLFKLSENPDNGSVIEIFCKELIHSKL